MERYTELVSRLSPSTLYHYTGNAAALEILTNGEIWATNIHFLNDSSEFKHALDLLKQEIEMRLSTSKNKQERDALHAMSKESSFVSGVNVVTASFSEQRDDLSQWRGYGNGSGVAIGFAADRLRSIAHARNFVLAPCIYKDAEHLGLINELIDDALPKYLSPQSMLGPKSPHLMPRVIMYAPIIKNGKFSAEAEWRLTSRAISCTSNNYKFRTGQSTLIPYYAFPIVENQRSIVTEVVCGPTPHQDLAQSAMKSLLIQLDIDAEVSPTAIPFRNW